MARASVLIGLAVALAALVVPRPAHAQASRCADEVKKLQTAPELKIQGGTRDQVNSRAEAQTFLQEAAQAAAQNDEKTCRLKLQAAQVSLGR